MLVFVYFLVPVELPLSLLHPDHGRSKDLPNYLPKHLNKASTYNIRQNICSLTFSHPSHTSHNPSVYPPSHSPFTLTFFNLSFHLHPTFYPFSQPHPSPKHSSLGLPYILHDTLPLTLTLAFTLPLTSLSSSLSP